MCGGGTATGAAPPRGAPNAAAPPGAGHVGEDAGVRAGVGKLEGKCCGPRVLRGLGGFSCGGIAGQLDITEAAVMTYVFRARQKLKALLDGGEKEAVLYGLP